MRVKAWKEVVSIPTYKIGEANKNPMFLEKRIYQGSSGSVYPYAVVDKVYDEKEDKEWVGIFLENEYIKVMIMPELGGRIQMAYDKTNDYHFVYYNQVIKPALVGLTGPWISGGIEFNWPQHHRPSTFGPSDYRIEENEDGSKTVWVNEYEVMFRTRCSLGFTLYPDKAYIELHAKMYNRTPFPQTFLWWANPAVAVDEHYQSVFPPDVNAVYDHGKRDVSSFPIATGTYYKVDYSPGTDISVYSNIPVPTSYMAVNSAYNFLGGYHHQKKAGIMHVADHHVSPGKKQWTWGSGEFGKAWDKQLTDEDGPYFELMCGVYTDNQPDFSWIMPNEVKEFRQYFMPYKEIGYVKNASIDAMINFEIHQQQATIGVYVTQKREVTIHVKKDNQIVYSKKVTCSPAAAFLDNFTVKDAIHTSYTVEVIDGNGQLLIEYTPEERKEEMLPDPAKPISDPQAIDTIESLYLAGLHLEQYRHATYKPEDYYVEALRRDDSDIRCNNAMGLLLLRRGQFAEAEKYLLAAVNKLNRHNPNPYDSEPLYNLGVLYGYQGRYNEAFPYLYKSTWTTTVQDKAFYELAAIEAYRKQWKTALQMIDQSLARNYYSPQSRHLKTIILRKLGRHEEALRYCTEVLHHDLFDFGNEYEHYLLLKQMGRGEDAATILANMLATIEGREHTFIEIAIDYAKVGDYIVAIDLLQQRIAAGEAGPLLHYYIGYYLVQSEEVERAKDCWVNAFTISADGVFPNRLEDVTVLQEVIKYVPTDYKAHYYLGNFYYAKKRYAEAKDQWEQSIAIESSFPTALRNLGIAYYNKFDRKQEALDLYEKAFSVDKADARVLFELDQLHKLMNASPESRLQRLNNYQELVAERDDLYIEYITLHTVTRQGVRAKQLLEQRNFHPWEGGEGLASGQHIAIHIQLALIAMDNKDADEALTLLAAAEVYPENLGEGKLFGAQENDIHYWIGCAHAMKGNTEEAKLYWQKAAIGLSDPGQAIFYNDQQPDKIFYQGLAFLQLNQPVEAEERFARMIAYGEAHHDKKVTMDFFAVSHPNLMVFDDDINRHNSIHCYYLQGLGWLGRKEWEKAALFFQKGLTLDAANFGIHTHEWLRKFLENVEVNNKITVP